MSSPEPAAPAAQQSFYLILLLAVVTVLVHSLLVAFRCSVFNALKHRNGLQQTANTVRVTGERGGAFSSDREGDFHQGVGGDQNLS